MNERMVNASELVGYADIAHRIGQTRQVVWTWADRRHRTHFPEPVAVLVSGPLYLWPEVNAWYSQRKIKKGVR